MTRLANALAFASALALVALPATAQVVAAPAAERSVQSYANALEQDATSIAGMLKLSSFEALRQLRMQQASLPLTDAITERFRGRLTGIALEHTPAFRIVVRLTGGGPVEDEHVDVAGDRVAVHYSVGAPVTYVGLVQAIASYQAAMRASLLDPPGLGVDQRTGELVAVVSARDVSREGAEPLRARLTALTHVPVRLRVTDESTLDMSDEAAGVAGGMRMMGAVPGDDRRYICTAGFVVTDGERTALATAAHCPDLLSVRDEHGQDRALAFEGQWGWGNQDVQINVSPVPLAPTFFSDTQRSISRMVDGSQSRASTRAGDVVCHRGERTGYSCSLVELTDFAPAGDLCGGACLPTWTTVAGPTCKGGDSGSPVFLGNTAYGILKGGAYRSDGSCAFYFYMSTDYLPAGWRLLTTRDGRRANNEARAGTVE